MSYPADRVARAVAFAPDDCARNLEKIKLTNTSGNVAVKPRQKSLLKEELMSVETEAAGILPTSLQKYKQEIAPDMTIIRKVNA